MRRIPALASHMRLTQDQKLDEALRETFPASDAFWIEPEEQNLEPCNEPTAPPS